MAARGRPLADNRGRMSDTHIHDPRALRSRAAIRDAFLRLVLEQRYHAISVRALIAAAGVARSTFYEHFRGKDEVLADSLRGPFAPLADAIFPDQRPARLAAILRHFQDNRRLAPGVLAGAAGRRTAAVLAGMVDERLRGSGPLRLPSALVATQVAAMQLAVISAWLDGRTQCAADDLALALARSTAALVDALRVG